MNFCVERGTSRYRGVGAVSAVKYLSERTGGKEKPTFKMSLFLLKNKGTKRDRSLSRTEIDSYTPYPTL